MMNQVLDIINTLHIPLQKIISWLSGLFSRNDLFTDFFFSVFKLRKMHPQRHLNLPVCVSTL